MVIFYLTKNKTNIIFKQVKSKIMAIWRKRVKSPFAQGHCNYAKRVSNLGQGIKSESM